MPRHPYRDEVKYRPEEHHDALKALWEGSQDEIEEWFRTPWRDGRNAIRLCLDTARGLSTSPDSWRAIDWLHDLLEITHGVLTSADYDQATEIAGELRRSAAAADVFLSASLTIAANWIAKSDGGGYVPNSYLMGAFWPFLRDGTIDEEVACDLVGRARARDLGLDWMAAREPDHLFRWLWLNRRYRLAFVAVSR